MAVLSVNAQQYDDFGHFFKEAGNNSVLYRGQQARKYTARANGTFYWSTPKFVEGSVVMDGKLYTGVLLNIDAVRQQLLVSRPVGVLATELKKEKVQSFTIGGTRYENLRAKGLEDAPEGYFEIIYEGPETVYKQITKKLEFDANDSNHNGEDIGYRDEFYNSSLHSYWACYRSYYVLRDGKLLKFRNKKTFISLYPKHKKELKKYAKSNELKNSSTPLDLYAGLVGAEACRLSYGETATPVQTSREAEITAATYTATVPVLDFVASELPAGYFDKGSSTNNEELLKYIASQNAVAEIQNKVYEIGDPNAGRTGKVYLSGHVRDVSSGEPIIGVAVYDDSQKAYAVTDDAGFFRIGLPVGEGALHFSGYSLEDVKLNLIMNDNGSLDVVMKEKVTSLKGAVITAEAMTKHRDATIGLEKIRINTISKIPTAFGEADIIKAVTTLPGVKTNGDASSGFNVRGGAVDQNLILYNDCTIYNPSHMFGIVSSFDPDVISDAELYKSSIPAEYGGRISSVLSVRGREGNSKKVTGSLGLGLLMSRFHLEGPLKKDKTTFILGGRMTYSNWMLNMIPENSNYHGGKTDFSDINISINHKINDNNSLHAFAYWSRDQFSYTGDTTFRYSNLNASLKWRSNLTHSTKLDVSGGFDQYKNNLDNSYNDHSSYSYGTGVNQAFFKTHFTTKVGAANTLSYGLNEVFYMVNPGTMKPLHENSLIVPTTLDVEKASELSAFFGDNWQVDEKISLDGGVRMTAFTALESGKTYFAPEFRVSAKYSPMDNLSFKGGFNSLNQYIHLISNTSSISPMDSWKLSDENIRPQSGWQAAAGAYWTQLEKGLDISLEGYYKHIAHYHDYISGANLIMNPELADDLVETSGKAYGVEFMVKKSVGKLTGWLSYTWSRSLLKEDGDRGPLTINHGDWYSAPQDKPHDVKLVGNYKFTHRFSLSFNADYSTGRPVTVPIGIYQYGGGNRLYYSERNGYRIPDYFRLDAAMNIEPSHYLKQLTHMSITFGVYNLTGRKNAYSVYYTSNGGRMIRGYMMSVFSSPIPYINLNLKF